MHITHQRLPQIPLCLTLAAGFLALTLLAFGRSLSQGFAPFDDDLLIVQNLAAHGITFAHLKTVFTSFDPELYIPLTFISYQIDYMIAGLAPWIYHLTNILLHALNGMLIGWLLLLLTKRRGPALFAALIFIAHPLNTEAVVWVAGRKDLLSTMFFLLSMITYVRYRKNQRWSYAMSIVFFIFALLSKVMAATLPAILILFDFLIERRKWDWKMLTEKIPHIILSAIFILIAALGKERTLSHHSMLETALMAAKSTVFYLQKMLLPIHLGMFYPYHGDISIFVPAFFIPVCVMLLILGVTLWSMKKHRTITFGILFFLITLAPTFTNFHKGGEMYFASDRYPYLPSIGLLFLLAMGIGEIFDRLQPREAQEKFWIGGGACIVAILCLLSFLQTRIWDSAANIFENTLALYPESVAARSSLAMMKKDQGRYDQAIKLLRDGLRFGESVELRMGLGTVYAKVGRVDDAADQFMKAQALDPLNPEPLVGLGVLDEYRKNLPKAMEEYRKAVDLDPSYVDARNKLGAMLLDAGKTAEAEAQFRAALRWNPNADGVLFNLSVILDMQGKSDEALEALEKAHALNPDSAPIAMALAKHLRENDPRNDVSQKSSIIEAAPAAF